MLINEKQKKKIVFVVTKPVWGGAQKYVFDLATNISKQEYDVTVLTGGTGPLTEKLQEEGVSVMSVSGLERDIKYFGEFTVLKNLTEIFKELSPDIIHLNSSKVGGIGALAGRRAKVPRIIFTAHGWAFNESRGVLWKVLTYIASWATALLSHIVITISYKEEAQALRFPFISSSKIRMIYIGLGKHNYLSREDARRYIQGVNKKTPDPGALWLGSIGELHKNKGHIYALELCKKLKEDGKQFFYFLIGDGEERETLETYIRENQLSENVALLGRIPSTETAATLLKAFDIFVFPSTKEGLPYVLLEAGAAEVPVIATIVGGVSELITQGESGVLVPPGSAEELKTGIETIWFDDRKRGELAKNLHIKITSSFMLEAMLEHTYSVYIN